MPICCFSNRNFLAHTQVHTHTVKWVIRAYAMTTTKKFHKISQKQLKRIQKKFQPKKDRTASQAPIRCRWNTKGKLVLINLLILARSHTHNGQTHLKSTYQISTFCAVLCSVLKKHTNINAHKALATIPISRSTLESISDALRVFAWKPRPEQKGSSPGLVRPRC